MLSYSSERRLFELLDTLKEAEMSQEINRQRLSLINNFAPYSAFMRIDRDANEHITAVELLNFLRDNREYTVTESDCHKVVQYFDSNNDGRLSF